LSRIKNSGQFIKKSGHLVKIRTFQDNL